MTSDPSLTSGRALLATASLCSLLTLWPGLAAAQGRLAAALAARTPAVEIVLPACRGSRAELVIDHGWLCVHDPATDAVRVSRRVMLGFGRVTGARIGDQVVFAVQDREGAGTRFSNRAWRWDLARDATFGLSPLPDEGIDGVLRRIVEGAIVSSPGGWVLHGDGTEPRRLAMGSDLRDAFDSMSVFVHEGRAYGTTMPEPGVLRLHALQLDAARLEARVLATYRGRQGVDEIDDGALIIIDGPRGRPQTMRVVSLPALDGVEIPWPDGPETAEWLRPSSFGQGFFSSVRRDADGLLVVTPLGGRARIDLASRTITALRETPSPITQGSSIVSPTPIAGGLYLTVFDADGWTLDARGVTAVRRPPRRAASRCGCRGSDLVCRRGPTVAEACTDVQELDQIREGGELVQGGQSTQYAPDGRFRYDRLEADRLRVTRLADGARIWVRILGDEVVVQDDQGGWFSTARGAPRQGWTLRRGGILDGAISPFEASADALFRPHLVEDFFASPPLSSAGATSP